MDLPLKKIDETLLSEHASLSPEDECYYFHEYTAGRDYTYSIGNALIKDLKKPVDRRGRFEWNYKNDAILETAYLLNHALPDLIDYSTTTLCPIPTSSARTSPSFDNRLFEVLRYACPPEVDIRELIICKQDHIPAHKREYDRPSVRELMEIFRVNPGEVRETVVLFDDVIVSGNHFVACQKLIQELYPGKRVLGVFLARRALACK